MSSQSQDPMAVSIRQRLLNRAKIRGEDYNLVLTRYALERFLHRLSRSAHRQEFILKGAMLFQIWSQTPHRATKDLDLLARGDVTPDAIKTKLLEICATDVEADGLSLLLSSPGGAAARQSSPAGCGGAEVSRLYSWRLPITPLRSAAASAARSSMTAFRRAAASGLLGGLEKNIKRSSTRSSSAEFILMY